MTTLTISLIQIVLAIGTILFVVMNTAFIERRISAFIQDRIGPNRVGPYGLLQMPADVLKLLFKESIVPKNATKSLHDLAPIISIGVALSTFAVIPYGDTIELFGLKIKLLIADVNIGILYLLAITSLGVYGITLAGWSSNNKYSLLGGLRSAAQLISYELSMGLSIIGVLIISESLQLDKIVYKQANYFLGWIPAWNIFLQPVGFIIFLVTAFAETNRLPFDLPEAEPELVAGYHTEYSGLKWGLFMLAEYANMITSCAVITTLFLGGWHVPYIESLGFSSLAISIIQILGFCVKVSFLIFVFMVVRWTIPRFRYDQLMNLGWKVLLPLSLANVLVTSFVVLLLS